MSDVINSIFGRPKNETAGSSGYSYGTVDPEPETEEAAVVVEEADSAPEADTATETAEDEAADTDRAEDATEESADETAEAGETSDEDVTGTDEEAVTEDTEEDDTDAAEDTAETETESDAEDAAETDSDAEAESLEPAAETEPVAEAVTAEPVADIEPAAEAAPVVAAEPAAEPAAEADAAATRPAAGSRGSTTIADGVVGKIVVRIAAQTEGVHSVAEDGITVELADEVAWVTIPVVVEFGHAVKALGEQIRVAVIDAVEQYLGLDVEVVDVHVTDIHFPEAR